METANTKGTLSAHSVALGIIALAFLAGIVGGCFLSVRGGAAADGAVADYLSPLAGSAIPRPAIGRVIINTFIYPVLCFALGYSIPGIALIPAVICTKGFFLSYAVASCVKVFGEESGILFSLSLLGPHLLITLPCLFLLGTYGLLGSIGLLSSFRRRAAAPMKTKESFMRFGIIICALAAAAAVEIYCSPALASLVASKVLETI
jgi:uncharacterized membrane protein SpoIIM required for sporulation